MRWRAKLTAINTVGAGLKKPRGETRAAAHGNGYLTLVGTWELEYPDVYPKAPPTYCEPVETIFCASLLQSVSIK